MRTDIEYVRSLESRLEEMRTAANQADEEYREEIARLRITDAEREAVEFAYSRLTADTHYASVAATLRGLLERLGGGV